MQDEILFGSAGSKHDFFEKATCAELLSRGSRKIFLWLKLLRLNFLYKDAGVREAVPVTRFREG